MNTASHTEQELSVREDDHCFVCGAENPVGLKLDFREANGGVETVFVPAPEHQGFVGIVHGGLVGLVLDEAMAKLVYLRGLGALTCEITVRLRRVVRVGEPLKVTASLGGERRRLLYLEANATDAAGDVVATAHAKFVRVRSKQGPVQSGPAE
jgi:acyl-coenzyme A thioesterase PaaI-like protein